MTQPGNAEGCFFLILPKTPEIVYMSSGKFYYNSALHLYYLSQK